MKLKKLFYKNNLTGWNVEEVKFDNLTLLVGASGVGKTQILHALSSLARIAQGDSENGIEWELSFEQNGVDFVWAGKFETVASDVEDVYNFKEQKYKILQESLLVGEDEMIQRDQEVLMFCGQPTVKLDACKSAIELLKAEEEVAPVYKGFRHIYQLTTDRLEISISPFLKKNDDVVDLRMIKDQDFLNPFDKLFLLKRNKLPEFNVIKEQFKEIFPLVEEIDFAVGSFFNDKPFPILKLKEKNVDAWILQPNISSGMRRTLAQIITLVLADDGDIVLIDEFENGLGVNCINQLAELILDPDSDIQVIMTSHHPYIINAIPFNKWKVVTREASNVSVHTAAELNIGQHSKHDAFMQLIQTSAYKTGVL